MPKALQFSRQRHHPCHEEGQEKENDGVAEGVAHAVVEEFHAGFGPEKPRGTFVISTLLQYHIFSNLLKINTFTYYLTLPDFIQILLVFI